MSHHLEKDLAGPMSQIRMSRNFMLKNVTPTIGGRGDDSRVSGTSMAYLIGLVLLILSAITWLNHGTGLINLAILPIVSSILNY